MKISRIKCKKSAALLIIFLSLSFLVMADVKPARIFSDNAVLQRNKPIPVWGMADPGEKIVVEFNGKKANARAGKDGKWKVQLKPENAGGPYTMIIQGKNRIELKNILIGEVWLCSGQSNMEMFVRHSYDNRYSQDISSANNDKIRHFKVERTVSDTLMNDVKSKGWELGNDTSAVADFSSVGYFFAQKLYEKLKVPIGIVNSTWGGTIVETWISPEAIKGSQELNSGLTASYKEVAGENNTDPNIYPSLLYKAMINPLVPYAIRGFLWYQGESNASRAFQYRKAFPVLIENWRDKWNQDTLPFYFVQLASWMANNGTSNTGSTWAELRESQLKTLSLPNTGMAVAIDIGDTKDIHPPNKKDVGLRLAAIALNKTYGLENQYSGPLFQSVKVENGKAIVSFDFAKEGLEVKDKYGYLKGFELAGDDRKFYYAKAHIEGNQVVVHSDSVANPVAVRYAWADDMPEANLYNKSGFPAVPFRTDNWPGLTDAVRYKVK